MLQHVKIHQHIGKKRARFISSAKNISERSDDIILTYILDVCNKDLFGQFCSEASTENVINGNPNSGMGAVTYYSDYFYLFELGNDYENTNKYRFCLYADIVMDCKQDTWWFPQTKNTELVYTFTFE